MKAVARLKIAIQKNGRLNNDSLELLIKCGLKFRLSPQSLLCHVENLPIDILFVRDDDIPTLVKDNICDLGIVGENVLFEKKIESLSIAKKLGFSCCKLAIAFPKTKEFTGLSCLQNLRIATSYPNLLQDYLKKNNIKAEIMEISGSVEIAPKLGMANAICDLVSTGRTLEDNELKVVAEIMRSQAVLIKKENIPSDKKMKTYPLLLRRIDSVLVAKESKYIMFHVPKKSLSSVKKILPGVESPTILPLSGKGDKVAVHVVSTEGAFWNTLENLKNAGASSILVLPIEKILY